MQIKKLIKDNKKRIFYIETELIQRVIKILCFNFRTNVLFFAILKNSFRLFNRRKYKTQIKNFCVISGRSRAVHKRFKTSRIILRELSGKGYFFGLKKASW